MTNYYSLSLTSDTITLDGKISDSTYTFKWLHPIKKMDFDVVMKQDRKNNVFFYESGNNKILISVWTSPKRTKTNPLPRVYTTLGHDGIKITIIPVLKEEGESGEQNVVHANTLHWMTALDVYVIIGVYDDAKLGRVGKQAANAKEGKISKQGNPKFVSQILDSKLIKKQIYQIVQKKLKVEGWNVKQIEQIPSLLEKSIKRYRTLGTKLNVPLKNESLTSKERSLKKWMKNPASFLDDQTKSELDAQNREIRTRHKSEDIPKQYGTKGKINIDCGNSKMLYLTADAIIVKEQEKTITITEAKNTKTNFPSDDDIRDSLMKLMLFKKTDFKIDGKPYDKKLRCCLKGRGNITAFRQKFQTLINECSTNEIELRFNDEIIK